MTIVSSREFADHQQKYFNLALNEQVFVKNGKNMFQITCEPAVEEQALLAPDDDFRRAFSAEEFRKSALEVVEKVHRKFYGNGRKICPGNA